MHTGAPAGEDRAVALIATHAERYPAWCVADVYKLVFQACMGPGHAVRDTDEARRRLFVEWNSIEPTTGALLLEDLSFHSPLWRLHLGPAKALGTTPDEILDRFVRCARSFIPRHDLLVESWSVVPREISAGRVPVIDADTLQEFDRRIRAAAFPSIGHSEAFRMAYSPAYRLVDTILDPEGSLHRQTASAT